MLTVITAIHRAVEPRPAISMPAPTSIIGTAIQMSKGFMTRTSILLGVTRPQAPRCPLHREAPRVVRHVSGGTWGPSGGLACPGQCDDVAAGTPLTPRTLDSACCRLSA